MRCRLRWPQQPRVLEHPIAVVDIVKPPRVAQLILGALRLLLPLESLGLPAQFVGTVRSDRPRLERPKRLCDRESRLDVAPPHRRFDALDYCRAQRCEPPALAVAEVSASAVERRPEFDVCRPSVQRGSRDATSRVPGTVVDVLDERNIMNPRTWRSGVEGTDGRSTVGCVANILPA